VEAFQPPMCSTTKMTLNSRIVPRKKNGHSMHCNGFLCLAFAVAMERHVVAAVAAVET
jgi:hypothetical protein